MSYGDSFADRINLNCSHPAEELMMSMYSMVMPISEDTLKNFAKPFRCPYYSDIDYVRNNYGSNSQYRPEINYLATLFNERNIYSETSRRKK